MTMSFNQASYEIISSSGSSGARAAIDASERIRPAGAGSYPVEINLAGIDLNLLVALEALLERCNVTHAASVVGLSQPAMSRALSRLRGMFNDELLVRTSTGYVRTIRGEQLYARLPATLDAVRDLIKSRSCAADSWGHSFRLAIPDHQALILLRPLSDRLQHESIGAELIVEPLTANLWKRLENGELEAAIGHFDDAPNGFFKRTLYKDPYVSVVRHDHPLLKQDLSFSQFVDLQHAMVSPGEHAERTPVCEILSQVHPKNRWILSPNTLGTAMAVAESDMIFTVPRRAATKLSELLPLQIMELPVDVSPYEVMLLWHERSHKSPEHGIVRSQIATTAQLNIGEGLPSA